MMTVTDFHDDGNCIPKLRVMVFVQFLLFHVRASSDQNTLNMQVTSISYFISLLMWYDKSISTAVYSTHSVCRTSFWWHIIFI